MTTKTMNEAEFEALCEREVEENNLVPDHHQDYEEWLEETGKDDSFVGSPERGIPGTGDLYDAAIRVFERKAVAEPGK